MTEQLPTPSVQLPTTADPHWGLGVGSWECFSVASVSLWFVGVAIATAITLTAQANPMNSLAERYVRLVLAMAQHDADYVDAFYGPAAWKQEVEAEKLPLAGTATRAAALARDIAAAAPAPSADEMLRLRHRYLGRQLEALRARAAM